jgi:hypothetical protein
MRVRVERNRRWSVVGVHHPTTNSHGGKVDAWVSYSKPMPRREALRQVRRANADRTGPSMYLAARVG